MDSWHPHSLTSSVKGQLLDPSQFSSPGFERWTYGYRVQPTSYPTIPCRVNNKFSYKLKLGSTFQFFRMFNFTINIPKLIRNFL